ncbi:flagellar basal body-associated FliL family protein [Escherichia coli]|nr:flagellar basal body-associated FliL family protein [Escherichia coli]EGK0567808.1 flagellar basal body-associated FliL family protein [Escherichia coli]EGN5964432.1 flagellar basal body-associated FliL family protein [Escherichia coli]EGP0138951.1 flagellar basal body-associated FliL family protein [Escherichia coli]EGP0142623.1 flagellar basal body-associated FliL family protein [Escherichia coli]
MNERLKTHSKTQKKSADLVSNKLRIGVFQRYQMKCKSVSKKSPRYMSAELVMVVASDKEAEKIKHQEPLYQSIAVECLTEMKFEDLRGMKISAIRKLISDALKKDLQRRKMSAPYKDLLVKKVVFQ